METDHSRQYDLACAETRRQIDSGLILGAVFARDAEGPVVALGRQCRTPERPMTAESRFDIASVGKIFTSSACALLAVEGKLDLDAPFTRYLPEHVLAKEGCEITVRDLAMHVGGFDNSKPYQSPDMEVFFRELWAKRPVWRRRGRFEYACSNFIYLGFIVERVTGMRLDDFCRERFWEPLGMRHTDWSAIEDDGHVVQFCVPDRPIGRHVDETCNFCPFPLGNGSVYSTIGDLRLFLADLLERRRFPRAYYDLLFTCATDVDEKPGVAGGSRFVGRRRSFGWDMDDAGRPGGLSRSSIFHSGWTGQTVCIDPEKDFLGIVLTSRLGDWQEAYDGRGRILSLLAGGAEPGAYGK